MDCIKCKCKKDDWPMDKDKIIYFVRDKRNREQYVCRDKAVHNICERVTYPCPVIVDFIEEGEEQ